MASTQNKLHYQYIPPCYIESNKIDLSKIDKIYFGNECGIGDNFVPRSFIRKVVSALPDKQFYSIHRFGPNLFKDIPQIKEITPKEYKKVYGVENPFYWAKPINRNFSMQKNPHLYEQIREDGFGGLHINTWYHSLEEMASKYYSGSAFPVLIYNFGHLFYALGIDEIEKPENYLPSVDYSYYNVDSLKNKLENIRKKFDEVVLVCNEMPATKDIVRSFDFDSFLAPKIQSNPKIAFIHTAPIWNHKLNLKNVFYTDNILSGTPKPDVIYMGFIAKYCDKIIGRMSGPMACTLTKEHLVDNPKQFLTTTDWPMLCEWAVERDYSKLDYVSPFDPEQWWQLLQRHFGEQKGNYSFG
jgi:hypothetical protein